MSKIVADVSAREGAAAVIKGTLDPAMAAKTLHASQLQTMVKLYERIQGYIFRLMATDSVPKVSRESTKSRVRDLTMLDRKVLQDAKGEVNREPKQDCPNRFFCYSTWIKRKRSLTR